MVSISMADILVVDDNRANREALASLLEVAGHDVRRAASAREALESALADPPDLVVSDVLMPGMDGYVLVRELRADSRTAALPVVFYTAYFAGQDAQDLAQAHGVARVLLKPSDNDLILRTVKEVLAERTPKPAAGGSELGGEHLRIVVDQLLEKTGALEAQQRRIERLNRTLETMSAINALIVRVIERADLLAEACRIAVERGGFGFAAIRLAPDERVVSSGEGSRDPRLEQFPVPLEATVCNDIEAAQPPGRESALRRGFRAYAVLPLVFSGQTAGALLLYARAKDVFDEEEMRLLHELAGDIAFALHHIAQKARMDYLAYHDSLTDLPTRSLFVDRLGQGLIAARRERRFAAAVFLDIERFRMVNESFGRRAGDELLREAAARLCASARGLAAAAGGVGAAVRSGARRGHGRARRRRPFRHRRGAVRAARGHRPGAARAGGRGVLAAGADRRGGAARHAEGGRRRGPRRRLLDRGAVRERGNRAQPREAGGLELSLLCARDERAGRRIARPRAPPAPRDRGRPPRAALPAESGRAQRAPRRAGGAHPLAGSRARRGAPGEVRVAHGGDRHDPGRRALGARARGARHPALAGARPGGAAHLGQRLGDPAAAEGFRRLGARGDLAVRPRQAAARRRDHRERAGGRHRRDHAQAPDAAPRRRRDLGRRLRHRLLLAQLPRAPAGRCAEDRPQLRRAHARRRLPAQHRRHDRFARAYARPQGHRRGRRGRRAGEAAEGPRLRPDPGLSREPAGAAAGHRGAAAARGARPRQGGRRVSAEFLPLPMAALPGAS